MNFIHYGRDPDPKTVDVRMTALAAEGFTAASFGLSEHQLRHHLDPCHEPELFELLEDGPSRPDPPLGMAISGPQGHHAGILWQLPLHGEEEIALQEDRVLQQ